MATADLWATWHVLITRSGIRHLAAPNRGTRSVCGRILHADTVDVVDAVNFVPTCHRCAASRTTIARYDLWIGQQP